MGIELTTDDQFRALAGLKKDCPRCGGHGRYPTMPHREICTGCKGAGKVAVLPGLRDECPCCGGDAAFYPDCPDCDGKGWIPAQHDRLSRLLTALAENDRNPALHYGSYGDGSGKGRWIMHVLAAGIYEAYEEPVQSIPGYGESAEAAAIAAAYKAFCQKEADDEPR